jgi:hypothetical protein
LCGRFTSKLTFTEIVARRRFLGLSWPPLKNEAVPTDCVPATRPSLHRRGVDHAGAVEAVADVQKPGDELIVFRPQLNLWELRSSA